MQKFTKGSFFSYVNLQPYACRHKIFVNEFKISLHDLVFITLLKLWFFNGRAESPFFYNLRFTGYSRKQKLAGMRFALLFHQQPFHLPFSAKSFVHNYLTLSLYFSIFYLSTAFLISKDYFFHSKHPIQLPKTIWIVFFFSLLQTQIFKRINKYEKNGKIWNNTKKHSFTECFFKDFSKQKPLTCVRGFEPPTFWSVAKRSIQLS